MHPLTKFVRFEWHGNETVSCELKDSIHVCTNCFVSHGGELNIPSINNFKGQVKRLKDALSRSQTAHRLTPQTLHMAYEEKRLLQRQALTDPRRFPPEILAVLVLSNFFSKKRQALLLEQRNGILLPRPFVSGRVPSSLDFR